MPHLEAGLQAPGWASLIQLMSVSYACGPHFSISCLSPNPKSPPSNVLGNTRSG